MSSRYDYYKDDDLQNVMDSLSKLEDQQRPTSQASTHLCEQLVALKECLRDKKSIGNRDTLEQDIAALIKRIECEYLSNDM